MALDEIYSFAPASLVQAGKSWLDDFHPSFKQIPSRLSGKDWRGFAGEDPERARELEALLNEPRFLMGARGGYGSARILPHFSPSWAQSGVVCGFSDLTALINYLPLHSQVFAFHGPVMAYPKGLIPGGWLEQSFRAFFLERSVFKGGFQGEIINGSRLEGPLIGGNLSVLCSLFGTPYAPSLAGRVLILEDISEATYRVDRLLNQLSQQPGFSELNGIVFGAFENCLPSPPGSSDLCIDELLYSFAADQKFPVVMNAPFGHLDDFLVLPLFGSSRWELSADKVTFLLTPPWETQ